MRAPHRAPAGDDSSGDDDEVIVEPRPPRARRRSAQSPVAWGIGGAFAAAAPWAWFAVRDRFALFEVVAILLPILGFAALALAAGTVAVVASRRDRWRLRWGERWRERWRQRRRMAAVTVVASASTVAMTATAVMAPWTARPLPGPAADASVRLVVVNVRQDNLVQDAAAAKLLALDGDLVVTAETPPQVDEALEAAYPYDHGGHRPWREEQPGRPGNYVENGVGVYARLPFTVLPDPPGMEVVGYRVARVRVEAPAGPFVLYALHLPKPGARTREEQQANPFHYARVLAALQRSVAAEELPVVVAGDLNLTDRGPGYRWLTGERGGAGDAGARLRDAMRTTRTGPTSIKPLWRPLLLRIDHVLVSDGVCASDADRVRVPGADHRALVVRVGPCPPGGSASAGAANGAGSDGLS